MMTFEGSLYSGGKVGLFDNPKNNSENDNKNESDYNTKKVLTSKIFL